MAMRVLAYGALLYQHLIREKVFLDQCLPPLLPLVLYNGKDRWTAAVDVGSLIEPGPPALDAYRLQGGRYWLIDERRYADHELASARNLVAATFRKVERKAEGKAEPRGVPKGERRAAPSS